LKKSTGWKIAAETKKSVLGASVRIHCRSCLALDLRGIESERTPGAQVFKGSGTRGFLKNAGGGAGFLHTQGCQIFLGTIYQNGERYQITTKYSKRPENRSNGSKICRPHVNKLYQHLPLQGTPKCTQSGIFGLKINHLATLFLQMTFATIR
jgi:hypothetical protein